MLYEQKPAGQTWLITSSMSFGLSLDALAGSGVTEDEETTVTSSSDEAVRAGGVKERLIHDTGSSPGCCCGLLHPHCSQQSADVSDPAKKHKYNTKAVIITQSHLISVLEVTNWSYFTFFPHFFSQMLPSSFLAGPAPPQKICSKGTEIKNYKSAAFASSNQSLCAG